MNALVDLAMLVMSLGSPEALEQAAVHEVQAYVHADVTAVAPSACHARELAKVRKALPATKHVRVLWGDLSSVPAWGLAFVEHRTVAISTAIPCANVVGTYAHEAVHQVTADRFGGSQATADEALGREAVELVADCGSERVTKRLGAKRYAPYIDGKVAGYEQHHGCPKDMSRLASDLGF